MSRRLSPWIGTEGRFYVYVHSKPDGTPFYIGKGTMYRAFRVKHSRNEMHGRIVAEHGAASILVSIIECGSNEEAGQLERSMIAEYRQIYEMANLSTGGQGSYGYKWTPEQRAKIPGSRKGLVHTKEHRAAIARGHLGRKNTPEVCEKMSRSWTDERRKALGALMANGNCPSKRPGVAEKISAATRGKPKPSLKGLRSGWKSVHTHDQTRFVRAEEVEALLLQGWKPGLGPRNRKHQVAA